MTRCHRGLLNGCFPWGVDDFPPPPPPPSAQPAILDGGSCTETMTVEHPTPAGAKSCKGCAFGAALYPRRPRQQYTRPAPPSTMSFNCSGPTSTKSRQLICGNFAATDWIVPQSWLVDPLVREHRTRSPCAGPFAGTNTNSRPSSPTSPRVRWATRPIPRSSFGCCSRKLNSSPNASNPWGSSTRPDGRARATATLAHGFRPTVGRPARRRRSTTVETGTWATHLVASGLGQLAVSRNHSAVPRGPSTPAPAACSGTTAWPHRMERSLTAHPTVRCVARSGIRLTHSHGGGCRQLWECS